MTALATVELPGELEVSTLGRTTPLGHGGFGTVEDLVDRPANSDGQKLVLKRFHAPEGVDRSALRALVQWRRNLPTADRNRIDRVSTWPLAAVIDGTELVGFVMRKVPDSFADEVRLPSGSRRPVLREAQYLLAHERHARRLGVGEASAATRLEIIWALAETLALLHRHHVVIGDVSPRNILWRSQPSEITLVDCDSFTLGGVGSPLPATSTIDWDDPAQPNERAASADIYKLALFTVRSLSRTFQDRDPTGADSALDPSGRWLLRMSLDPDPTARPNADAWERWAAGRRATARLGSNAN